MSRFLKCSIVLILLFFMGEIGARVYLAHRLAHLPDAPDSPDEFGVYENFLLWGKNLGYLEDYKLGNAYYFTPYVGVINQPGLRFKFKNYDVEINSEGLRAREIISPKPKNIFRVFILGGSTVAGGVNEKSCISHYLEGYLHPKTKRLEVINAGIVGYSSINELILLETQILQLQPNLVIVFDGRNDLYYANFPDAAPASQEQRVLDYFVNSPKPIRLAIYWVKTIGHRSALLTALFRIVFERGAVLIKAPPDRFDPQIMETYFRNWRSMSAILEAHQIPSLLIFQPTLAYGKETDSSYEQSAIDYKEKVEKTDWIKAARRLWEETSKRIKGFHNTPFVKFHDLSLLFLHDKNTEYFDDCHYSADACRKIAGEIARLARRDFPGALQPMPR